MKRGVFEVPVKPPDIPIRRRQAIALAHEPFVDLNDFSIDGITGRAVRAMRPPYQFTDAVSAPDSHSDSGHQFNGVLAGGLLRCRLGPAI